MAYKEVIKQNGALLSKYVKETVDDTPKRDKKSLARADIEKEVFDLHDSVADNAKMISLLMSMVESIYSIIPDTEKNNLPIDVKTNIEHAIQYYNQVDTWGKMQLRKEGTTAITKLIDRQKKLADVIKRHYGA